MEQQAVAEEGSKKKQVCVIGAGAAGLCAARHLAAEPRAFEFVVFEKSADVGGTWTYTDRVGLDENGQPVHSSMYKNLRTNLPREIMNFPDFREIKGGDQSCVSHGAILDYLKNYADHFKLRQFIQFNTTVESVKLEPSKEESSPKKWRVEVKNTRRYSTTNQFLFDAVIVCNGHYFEPRIPQIRGLKNFDGRLMHSHDYRKPDEFAGKSVLLLGASSSGSDIALELSKVASRVYLSHNNERLTRNVPLGFTEVPGIENFDEGKFILKDGSTVSADALILCTGYLFSYPFLDASCGIRVHDNHVTPLYRHLINTEHPTMCLIGVPMVVVPFPMFHMQVQYFLSTLSGRSQLPALSEMLEDSKLAPNTSTWHAHKLSNRQWSYNDDLARTGRFEPLSAYYKLGYEAWSGLRRTNLRDYKRLNLVLSQDEKNVEVVAERSAT